MQDLSLQNLQIYLLCEDNLSNFFIFIFRYKVSCWIPFQWFMFKLVIYYECLFNKTFRLIHRFDFCNMEASKPKWVNPILNIIGVNSLRLGGLHIIFPLNSITSPKELKNNSFPQCTLATYLVNLTMNLKSNEFSRKKQWLQVKTQSLI